MTDPNTSPNPDAAGGQAPVPPAPPAGYPAPPAPPAYSAPAYGAAPAYSAPAGPQTNTLAIISLISSLVGVFIIPIIGQIVGVITGHMSLSQIKRTGENGRGLGLAGVIIGWVSLGLWIIGLIVFFGFLVAVGTAGMTTYRS